MDGMPTGRHFRLRVCDDVVTEKSVTTPEMIKKTTTAWELVRMLFDDFHGTFATVTGFDQC